MTLTSLLAALAIAFSITSGAACATTSVEGPLPPLSGKGALAPDGSGLVLATRGGGVLLVDLPGGHAHELLQARGARILGFRWDPTLESIAILRQDGALELVDRKGKARRAPIDTRAKHLGRQLLGRSVDFAADGTVLVVAGGSSAGTLWSVLTGERIATLGDETTRTTTGHALSKDGELLALGDEDGAIHIWKTRTGEHSAGPLELKDPVYALDFDPSGKQLAIGAGDCTLRVWDLSTRDEVRTFSHCDADLFGGLAIHAVRFSPDGSRLVSTTSSFFEARMWNLATSELLWKYDYGGGNPGSVQPAFTPDGKTVVLSRYGVVIDAEAGTVQRTLAQGAGVRTDGGLSWTTHGNTLRVFDPATADPILTRAIGQ